MSRSLILSSGAAWGAYHIGALRHLIHEKDLHFDLCAGTGIGAMNAAFVACGEFEALDAFWQKIGWLKLISPNWSHPFSEAPFTGKPQQRRFIEEHISIKKLEENSASLVFSTLNLKTGAQEYFEYPGSETPLMEAIMGAVAVPGLTRPYYSETGPLVEGTMVNTFIVDHVVSNYPADEYYAVAPLPEGKPDPDDLFQADHWREALIRTIQVNLSRDVNEGLQNAGRKLQAANAGVNARQRLLQSVQALTSDTTELAAKIEQRLAKGDFPLPHQSTAKLFSIISNEPVSSPLWSFRKKNIQALIDMGYENAVRGLNEGEHRMKTGLFLTPGAARTAYYVGALDVLIRESGIHFDVIAGSSVGALNGAFAAMDETRQLREIWKNWTTEDVMVNDYKALLQGGFFWAKNFASNEPEYKTGVRDYIFEEKIQDGVTFRFNIADLSTGTNRILSYPGENVPIQTGIMAAVSVPVLFEPVEIDGHQYVDGLAIEGCPLESLILQTGVDRVFVLGVSPRTPLENPTKNAYSAMLAASEWNQYTEPFYAVQQAEEENDIIRAWQKERESLKRLIDSSDVSAAEQSELTELLETSYADDALPYNRQPVEIHSIMPQHPIEMWFGEFLPSRSKKLMDMGRQDALHLLEKIPV